VPQSPAPPRCLVCGATAARVRYRLTRWSILTCGACGQVYLWPLPPEEEVRALFAHLYTDGQCDLPELQGYYAFTYDDDPGNPLVQLYERWLDALEGHHPPGRLADVGCGTGLFLAVARRRGWTPFGVDDCAAATRHARERFGLAVHTGDFAEFARSGETFDAITMWDIIEHARAPVELLATARRCLAPGGILALATPNQRSILDVVAGTAYRLTAGRLTARSKFYIDQHFLYFTPETLAAALGRAGFDVVRLEREVTDLRRLTLSPPVRLLLGALLRLARWTRLENRLFVVARPRAGGR
jgi:SAM-dependent methyltransferase